ncbi:MAG: anti-sigma factor family protein [Bryobacteraceae bacterium]
MSLRGMLAGWIRAVSRQVRRHPQDWTLCAWRDGELGEAESRRVAAHVAECRLCQRRLERLAEGLELAHRALAAESDAVERLFEAGRQLLFGASAAREAGPTPSESLALLLLGRAAAAESDRTGQVVLMEGLLGRRAIEMASGRKQASGRAA